MSLHIKIKTIHQTFLSMPSCCFCAANMAAIPPFFKPLFEPRSTLDASAAAAFMKKESSLNHLQ